MAELALGIASIGLTLIDDAIRVLQYFRLVLADSKSLGADARKISTQTAVETARLQAFREFLHDPAGTTTRFELLPQMHQTAVVGMIQELDILFAAYSAVVVKYGLDLDVDVVGRVDVAEEMVRRATLTSTQLQLGASWKAKAAWGLFKKKNIEVAVQRLEEWNNKLQNFLLCGLCFLDDKKLMELRDGTTMEKLRLAPGLRLRAIITGANASTVDIVEDGMVLSPPVANSCLRTVNHTGGKPETVYVEYKPYKPRRGATQPSDAMIRRVRALGNLLCQPSASDAGFHTLSCRCIIKEKDHNGRALNRYAFLFRLPDGNSGEPISLSAAITIHHSHRPTLGQRFQIAKTLATTVFQLHSVGWLHKSIRSENILFFGAPGQMYSQQYLVGFEFSRDENDTSTMEQDDALERNIYRHPDRQGPPDTRFSVLHDIYSLGVILLEIGLWRPVIGFEAFADMDPDTVKERLREHANARLPHYMGRKYTRAVLECLDQTLVDGDVVALGGLERFRESVQIAFCEKVLGEIEGGVALE